MVLYSAYDDFLFCGCIDIFSLFLAFGVLTIRFSSDFAIRYSRGKKVTTYLRVLLGVDHLGVCSFLPRLHQ